MEVDVLRGDVELVPVADAVVLGDDVEVELPLVQLQLVVDEVLEVADVLLDVIDGDEVGVDVVLVVRVDVELVLVGDEVVLEDEEDVELLGAVLLLAVDEVAELEDGLGVVEEGVAVVLLLL